MNEKHPSAVELGKLGGAVKSDAKNKSSRVNGKLGGRPRSAFTVSSSKNGPTLQSFTTDAEARAWIASQKVVRKRTYWMRTAGNATPIVVMRDK